MATLKDVAKLANVDVSTVSRALNNTSYVHPETKKRVFAAARELSYQPNLMAKALKQGRKNAIGIVVPDLRLTVFSDITRAMIQEASNRGYVALISVSNDDPAIEREALLRLKAGFVDALAIAPTNKNTSVLIDMYESGFPIVQMVRRQVKTIPSVISNHFASGHDAVEFFYKKGCRKIAFIDGPLTLSPYLERYKGYMSAIHEFGLEPLCYEIEEFEGRLAHYEYGYEGTKKLFATEPDIDALLVAVDLQGIAAIRALKEIGKKVPEEVMIISLTGNSLGDILETKMSAFETLSQSMGKQIVTMLIDAVENSGSLLESNQQMIFDYKLVERETTRPSTSKS